jgi:predicted AAA+ superfamily ATPase
MAMLDRMLDRTMGPFIESVSRAFPVLMLTGMRQVGKSTLLEMLRTRERKYVSLDDLRDRELARNDPALFIQRYEPPVVIDEIQYAPELFPYIKIYADTHAENGLFWLTGPQQFQLMKGIRESLAGRVAILDLLGFSCREMEGRAFSGGPFLPSMDLIKNVEERQSPQLLELYRRIWLGSFPRLIVHGGENREIFYKSYLQTYIERDIRNDLGVGSETEFYNFIRAVAVRSGNLLNYAALARDVNIDARTAKTWMSALERSGVVKLLEPYYNNITKRMIKTPKVYFMDTGLAAYLANMDTPAALEASYLTGSMLETYAFAEIMKSYRHNGREPDIFFFRDADQKEIDFVIEQNGTLYPIDVKKTATPSRADAKNFEALRRLKKPLGVGAVVCLRQTVAPLAENLVAVPVWEI